MNYYEKIKNELIDNELTKKAKDYSKNKSDLMHYYNVGKLLIEAQGGEARAKYGDGLIKVYSERLTNELGYGYSTRTLKRMRKFYLFQKGTPVVAQSLSWSHYVILLSLNDFNEINYYVNQIINNHWSKRILQVHIKNKEYQRLDDKTKNKLVNEDKFGVVDLVKNPIVIKNAFNIENISEKYLKKLILDDMDNFLSELGNGFTYASNEYKIRIGDTFNYIDLLLFNIEFNCYVVVELKVTGLKKEHIGQIQVYMNYIDKNLRKINHDKTIGIIICKKDNKLVLEYSSDSRIYSTTYELIH